MAAHLVKIACERPDAVGRSLSQWDCRELAAELVGQGVVRTISPDSVRRILDGHRLKPWRHHLWIGDKTPRDQAFADAVREVCDLYTRALLPFEMVLCVDEQTNLQPRPRRQPTRAALPGLAARVEHEYGRCGSLNLFAALDTRSGRVYARLSPRKRADDFIAFLEQLDRELPADKTLVHVVLDNLRVHKSKKVKAWLAGHPRFVFHHPPVHCSWMNQVEQWFGILRRKRFGINDFADLTQLSERVLRFVEQWNQKAHAFSWTPQSFQKILAKCESRLAA